MSIATEITRLQNAKADIKAAIQEKGVDVGDGLIDTYADKITAISVVGDDYRTVLWNGIQDNGARKDYSQAFRHWKNAHNYWCPLHDINHNAGSAVFYGFTSDLGLPELCERAGITMDWSEASTFAQTFSYANIPDVGVIDTRGAKGLSSIFQAASIKKAHLIMKEDGSQSVGGSAFVYCNTLTDLTIDGAIGSSDVSIPSPLTPESMISVITHLVNYTGTTYEMAYTITFTDACWEALESHSTAPDGGSWKNYVMSLGWKI